MFNYDERIAKALEDVLSRLEPGSYRSLQATLSVVGAVTTLHNVQCTPAERQRLLAATGELAGPRETRSIYVQMVHRACAPLKSAAALGDQGAN